MRSRARFIAALLFCGLLPSTASAAGLTLRWDECLGSATKTFACNTNVGVHRLVGSYCAPAGVTQLSGIEVRLDILHDSPTVPDWWQFHAPGACRRTAASVAFMPPSESSCVDFWQGNAVGGIASYTTNVFGQPNRARFLMAAGVIPEAYGPLVENERYFAFTLTISNVKTVLAGACAGCAGSATLTLTRINLTQPTGIGDFPLFDPCNDGPGVGFPYANTVSWAAGETPARSRTWGGVKALYRW